MRDMHSRIRDTYLRFKAAVGAGSLGNIVPPLT